MRESTIEQAVCAYAKAKGCLSLKLAGQNQKGQPDRMFLFHPDDSDRGFLMWIHERLEHVHGESRLRDYMHKLRAIIADMPAERRTISVGQGKNSLESLQEFIVENA
jgi:hypothetical protein